MSPSPMQLLIVALIVILLFGASRIGELGKGLGQGIKNFKKGLNDDDSDEDEDDAKQLKGKKAKAEDDSEVEEKKEKA